MNEEDLFQGCGRISMIKEPAVGGRNKQEGKYTNNQNTGDSNICVRKEVQMCSEEWEQR